MSGEGDTPSSSGFTEFEEEETTTALALQLHNDYRQKHGVPPLVINTELSSLAEDYARAHIRGTKIKLDDARMGVNLFKIDHFSEEGLNTDVDAARGAVTAWYNSGKNYNWDSPSSSPPDTKPFQEVVWKESGRLGVGVVIGKDGIYAVALYSRNKTETSTTDEGLKENVLPLLSTT